MSVEGFLPRHALAMQVASLLIVAKDLKMQDVVRDVYFRDIEACSSFVTFAKASSMCRRFVLLVIKALQKASFCRAQVALVFR